MCTTMNQPKQDMEGSLCGFSKHASPQNKPKQIGSELKM